MIQLAALLCIVNDWARKSFNTLNAELGDVVMAGSIGCTSYLCAILLAVGVRTRPRDATCHVHAGRIEKQKFVTAVIP